MNIINIDERHNNSSCSVCCCEPIQMRAGETRLITLNYAPWTIPIMANGGPGLVPQPLLSITPNSESCHNESIDGFAAPMTLGDYFVANQALAINTALTFDLTDDVAPAGNNFEFKLHPVSGPSYGSLTDTALDGDGWTYTPISAFVGYDQFWVEITDAQGRTIIRPVNINVGAAGGIPPVGWGASAAIGLQIDRSKMQVNSAMQTLSFPVYLPPSNDAETIDACTRYRVTIKAFARDCNNEFTHITCLDVTSKGC